MNEYSSKAFRTRWAAMRLSLLAGLLLLLVKWVAYIWTSSTAILSDAAESVVHIGAVAFAAWGLRVAHQPPDQDHPYGHEKVNYVSAGFEGAVIVFAAFYILYKAAKKIIVGPELENLGPGAILIAGAVVVNALLGWHLIRTGRRENSLILTANGKHVLTDCVTSLGVLIALLLVAATGWELLDPLIAIGVAVHILVSGTQLVRQSAHGLMDRMDPGVDRRLREYLDEWANRHGVEYHGLRHRTGGNVVWVDIHLLFPGETGLESAHAAASSLESSIQECLPDHRVEVTSHLEPLEEHQDHHPEGGHQHR